MSLINDQELAIMEVWGSKCWSWNLDSSLSPTGRIDIAVRAVLKYINKFQRSHDMEAWAVRSRLRSEKFSTLSSQMRLLVSLLFR